MVAAETQIKQILLIINQLDKYKILDFYANKKIPAQNFQILNGGDVSFFVTCKVELFLIKLKKFIENLYLCQRLNI